MMRMMMVFFVLVNLFCVELFEKLNLCMFLSSGIF